MQLIPDTKRGKVRCAIGLLVLYWLQVLALGEHPDSDFAFFGVFVTLGILTFVVDSLSATVDKEWHHAR